MELLKRAFCDGKFSTIRKCLFIMAIFKHIDISIYVYTIFTLTKEKIPCESMWHLILFSITHHCGIYCIMNALRWRRLANKETSSKLLYAKEWEKTAERFYDFVWMEENSLDSCSIHFRTYQFWQFHYQIQIAETIKGLGIIFVYIYTVYRFAAPQLSLVQNGTNYKSDACLTESCYCTVRLHILAADKCIKDESTHTSVCHRHAFK